MNSDQSVAKRFRILCVDDAEVALQVRKLIFQHAGYDVVTARSGEEALEIFQREHVDIVIADHFLSNKSGTEIAREMKEVRPLVPILLVSAAAELPPGLQFVDGFVPKGETPDTLLKTISQLLHRSDSNPGSSSS
jgi:CheY-like chemotaxis protein